MAVRNAGHASRWDLGQAWQIISNSEVLFLEGRLQIRQKPTTLTGLGFHKGSFAFPKTSDEYLEQYSLRRCSGSWQWFAGSVQTRCAHSGYTVHMCAWNCCVFDKSSLRFCCEASSFFQLSLSHQPCVNNPRSAAIVKDQKDTQERKPERTEDSFLGRVLYGMATCWCLFWRDTKGRPLMTTHFRDSPNLKTRMNPWLKPSSS